MRFGIIGFGNIARKFVKSIEYTDEGIVSAIASCSIKEDDEYLKNHPEVKVYRDYGKMLQDDDIEAVYIALPHAFHKEWIIKALKYHKAVLSEKPLVLNSQDIDDIKKAVYENDGYCLEAFKTKLNHGFQSLKNDLSLIGDIQTIETNFCYQAENRQDSYLFDVKQGGALNDVGSYIIGFILAVVDSPIIKIVSTIDKDNDVEMAFLAKLYFKNGVVGIGEGSIQNNKERFALIKGTKGKIYIPMYNRIVDYTIKLENQVIERHFPIVGDDMTLEIQALIDDVKNHRHENAIHSLADSKYLQQVIEDIRKEAR